MEEFISHPLIWIALATILNEDLGSLGAGLAIARGDVSLWAGGGVCLAATLLGDLTWFLLGRFVGRPALRYPPLAWLFDERQYALAEAWVADRGKGVGLITRFLPGIRTPLHFFLGMLGMEVHLALLYLTIAACVYVPLLLGLAMLFGSVIQAYMPIYGYGAVVFGASLLLLLAVSHQIRRQAAWQEEQVFEDRPFAGPAVAARVGGAGQGSANPSLADGILIGDSLGEQPPPEPKLTRNPDPLP